MNKFFALAAAIVVGLTLNITDAEAARRLGGGGSTGMQRQATPPAKNTQQAAPAQQPAAPAAAAAAQPKRSWLGPIAGLAAGLGLAALASHLGFGEGLANFMMIALLAVAVIAVIGFFLRKKAGAQAPGMPGAQFAAAGADGNAPRPDFSPQGGASAAPVAAAVGAAANVAGTGHVPADFDAEAFARNAKLNFIRLQTANDAGNLDDIREFTTPEMFAEIKLAIDERKGAQQETDVVELNAQVFDVAEEEKRYVVSVHFSGLIREERNAGAESFSEIWHLVKPIDGSRGWSVAGIQQVQ